jgi:hypothetical protein
MDRMALLKGHWRRYLLATLFALGTVAVAPTPAFAAKWYQYPDWCGGAPLASINCTLEYTGSWPDGQARAQGQGGLFEIALEGKVGTKGAWKVVKATYPLQGGPLTTPAAKVGKNNWYRACVKTVKSAAFSCGGSVYLGD